MYPFRGRWRPVLAADGEGVRCIDISTERIGREPLPDEVARAERQLLLLLRTYRLCPDAAVPTTTVTGTINGVQTTGTHPTPGFETYSREAVD